MSRAATSRLKVNPPLGKLPVLQYVPPSELQIDASYQRSLDASASKSLIRKIAQFWNWDLCQPLVVSRRDGGEFFVIDGQHRLAAARLRPDIGQLPCVVVEYAGAADEAASFVHLNQQRRPLNALDVFKAAVASEDEEAVAIAAAIEWVGLMIAPHSNYVSWKPNMVSNIGGIQRSWRLHGDLATKSALWIVASAWPHETKRYVGTIFPGVAQVCANEDAFKTKITERDLFRNMVQSCTQAEWRKDIGLAKAENPNLKWQAASETVFENAWADFIEAYLDEGAE